MGFGRPGWHIECSVIALRYLIGPNFLTESKAAEFSIDLQGGGSDLVFPHHFMSGAQAEALVGRPFARLYVHSGMVGLDGEKMSKSKGNLVFVSKLLQQGEDAMVIRYALLDSHYASDRMWTADLLESAGRNVALIRQALAKEEVAPTTPVIQAIALSLANNLDSPQALHETVEWAHRTLAGETGGHAGELSLVLDALLGLAL